MLFTTITIKDKEYKLRLDAKNCIQLEKKLQTNPLNPFLQLGEKSELPSLDVLINTLYFSMKCFKPDMTIDEAFDLYNDYIDDGHSLEDIIPVILEVFKVSGFFKEDKGKKSKKA